jgi:uncharacterized membrane protein
MRPEITAAPYITVHEVDRAAYQTWIRRIETALVCLIGAFSVVLHFRLIGQAGGLWRDEANSVNLANFPSFGEMWSSLDYDSFPILFFALLRGLLAIFGVDNDFALRASGCAVGLGILIVLWLCVRSFGARVPLLSFALVGLNPMVIRYGDSVRAFGLGIVLIILAFWSYLKLVNKPGWKTIAIATATALLSVHCLYYNTVLIFALSVGAIAVAYRQQAWRTIAYILSIGLLAAASMSIYLPMLGRMNSWTFLLKHPCTLAWFWHRSCEVTGAPDPLGTAIWVLIVVGVLAMAGGFMFHSIRGRVSNEVLFAGVSLIVGIVAYTFFLKVLSYYTQSWYYITLAVFVACAADCILGSTVIALRETRVLLAVFILSLCAWPDWQALRTRHTNVDIIAQKLGSLAQKSDLIVVPRWECDITLERYYHGASEIITIPPISDHRVHRYDLIMQMRKTPDALKGVADKIAETLRAGHRVFVTASMATLEGPGTAHLAVSETYIGKLLRNHTTGVADIPVPIPDRAPVSDFEKLDLTVVQGWR